MAELDLWYDGTHADSLISYFTPADRGLISVHIEKESERRTHLGAFAKLTTMVNGRPRIDEDPPIRVTIDDDEQDALTDQLLASYRMTLQEDRRHLFDRFTPVNLVRQVVGVGSVGMRVYLFLLEGRSGNDPLFLQIKQAGPSVYKSHLGPSQHDNHGARVIAGKAGAAERNRHLRRLGLVPGQGLLRAAVPRHEDRPRHRACSPPYLVEFADRLRRGARQGPCTHRRPRGHQRLHRQGQEVCAQQLMTSPACTPNRTSGITPNWPQPSPMAPSRADPTRSTHRPVSQSPALRRAQKSQCFVPENGMRCLTTNNNGALGRRWCDRIHEMDFRAEERLRCQPDPLAQRRPELLVPGKPGLIQYCSDRSSSGIIRSH